MEAVVKSEAEAIELAENELDYYAKTDNRYKGYTLKQVVEHPKGWELEYHRIDSDETTTPKIKMLYVMRYAHMVLGISLPFDGWENVYPLDEATIEKMLEEENHILDHVDEYIIAEIYDDGFWHDVDLCHVPSNSKIHWNDSAFVSGIDTIVWNKIKEAGIRVVKVDLRKIRECNWRRAYWIREVIEEYEKGNRGIITVSDEQYRRTRLIAKIRRPFEFMYYFPMRTYRSFRRFLHRHRIYKYK